MSDIVFKKQVAPSNAPTGKVRQYINDVGEMCLKDENGVVTVIGAVGGNPGQIFPFASPLTTWTVNHNLGYKPQVQVLSSGFAIVLAEVSHVNNNQLTVLFNSPFTGYVKII